MHADRAKKRRYRYLCLESQDLEGFGVVAAVGVADAAVLQRRLLVDAQLPLVVVEHVGELLAAGAELAAGRRVRRARDVAGDDDPLPLALAAGIGQRDRREQRLRVRVRRAVE